MGLAEQQAFLLLLLVITPLLGWLYRTFFIRPKLGILPHEDTILNRIRVQVGARLGSEQPECEMNFKCLAITNSGRDTAEDVTPFVKLTLRREFFDNPLRLHMIEPPSKPWFTVKWPDVLGEFDRTDANRFATALVHTEDHAKSVTIYGKDRPQPFILFFSLKGSDGLYFPTDRSIGVETPQEFYLIICLRAKHLPFKEVKAYYVNAKSWDDVSMEEVKISSVPPPPWPVS